MLWEGAGQHKRRAQLEDVLRALGVDNLEAHEQDAVFAHLHPTGSVTMASQMALTMRTPADTTLGSLGRRITAMAASASQSTSVGTSGVNAIPYCIY